MCGSDRPRRRVASRHALASVHCSTLTALIGVGNAFFAPASSGFLVGIVSKDGVGTRERCPQNRNRARDDHRPLRGGAHRRRHRTWVDARPRWLSYAVSALCFALVALPPDRTAATISRKRNVARDLRVGFRAYAERRWLWLLVGQFGILNLIAIAPFRVLAPVLLCDTRRRRACVGSAARNDRRGSTRGRDWGDALAAKAHARCRRARVCSLLPLLYLLAANASFPLLLAAASASALGRRC